MEKLLNGIISQHVFDLRRTDDCKIACCTTDGCNANNVDALLTPSPLPRTQGEEEIRNNGSLSCRFACFIALPLFLVFTMKIIALSKKWENAFGPHLPPYIVFRTIV